MIPVLIGAGLLGAGWYWWTHKDDLPTGSVPTAPSGFTIASNTYYAATFRSSLTKPQVLAGLGAMKFNVRSCESVPGDSTAFEVQFSSPVSMALMNTPVYRWENVRVAG